MFQIQVRNNSRNCNNSIFPEVIIINYLLVAMKWFNYNRNKLGVTIINHCYIS